MTIKNNNDIKLLVDFFCISSNLKHDKDIIEVFSDTKKTIVKKRLKFVCQFLICWQRIMSGNYS